MILFRYGDTNDVLPIGGLVAIGETPIATGLRYYRQLLKLRVEAHDRLCLFRVLKGLNDLMSLRISLYIPDVKAQFVTMLSF